MAPLIHRLLSNLSNNNLHLLRLPAQPPRKIHHAKPMQPLQKILHHPHPPLLHHPILRPPINRPRMRLAANLLKPSRSKQSRKIVRRLKINPQARRATHHQPIPLHHRRLRRRRVVVHPCGEVQVLHLDPPARFEIGVALLEEAGPVADPHDQHPAVDVVEGAFAAGGRVAAGAEAPGLFGVFDVEAAVRGHVVGLHGREIGAYDVGGGVLVCHVDGPDAGACADV